MLPPPPLNVALIPTYAHTHICTYVRTCVMAQGQKLGGSKSTVGLHSQCSRATLM